MKLIPLTRGLVAKVDDADYESLILRKWNAIGGQGGRTHYASSYVKGSPRRHPKYEMMHRIILAAPSDLEVDHRDGDGLNNQRDNLRFATHLQNARNRHHRKGGGLKGVRRHGRRWEARICVNWKSMFLGSFGSQAEAAIAYNEAAARYHKDFASLSVVSAG